MKCFSIAAAALMAAVVLAGCGDKAENGADSVHAALADITVFGEKISLPCTRYELSEHFSFDQKGEPKNGYTSNQLRYDGTLIGTARLDDVSGEIVNVDFMVKMAGDEYLSVGGIGFKSTEEDVKKILGEPYKRTEKWMEYRSEDGTKLDFGVIQGEPVGMISYYSKNYKK